MTLATYLFDLAALLVSQGFGVSGKPSSSSGIEISVAGYHEADTNAIFLTPFESPDNNRVVSDEEERECQCNFQVIVRNKSQRTCINTATSIRSLFLETMDTRIGSTNIIGFSEAKPYGFGKKTNSGFFTYVVNFSIMIQE